MKTKGLIDTRIYSIVGSRGYRRSSLSLAEARKLAARENGKIYYRDGTLVSTWSKSLNAHIENILI